MKNYINHLILGLSICLVVPMVSGQPLNTDTAKDTMKEKLGGFDLSLSGILRTEGTTEKDLNQLTAIGGPLGDKAASESFYDIRSYITAQLKRDKLSLVLSLDIAGDDFTDPEGGIFGNGLDSRSVPGGPAITRDEGFDVRVRHFYAQYDGLVTVAVGRQPVNVGNGIVVSTIRDSIKIVKSLKPFEFGAVIIKGAETLPNNDAAFDPEGRNDNDLDAYSAFGKFARPGIAAQLTFSIQDDTRKDKGYPEKQIVNLSIDGSFNDNVSYQLVGTYLGGKSPFRAEVGKRLDNEAWQAYGKLNYSLPEVRSRLSAAFGYGTGDDDPTDDKQEDFQSLFMNAIGFHIANIYGNDIHSYDSFIPGTPGADGNNSGAGFANTQFLQVSGQHQLTDKLSLEAVYSYFRATEDRLVGEGVMLHPNDGTAAPGETRMTDDIGWEFDLNINYLMYDDFKLYARLGYFEAGDIWDRTTSNAMKAQVGFSFILGNGN